MDQIRQDLKNSLLQRKSGASDGPLQSAVLLLESIKARNDNFSKLAGSAMEDEMVLNIRKQIDSMREQYSKLKTQLDQLERAQKDLQSRKKIKQLKSQWLRQNERTNRLLKQFIVKSFVKRSNLKSQVTAQEQALLLAHGSQEFMEVAKPSPPAGDSNKPAFQPKQKQQPATSPTLQTVKQDFDYQIQERLQAQKQEAINYAEQNIMDLKEIIMESAKMVYEQHEQIVQISDKIDETHKNVLIANQQVTEAEVLQKRGRSRVCWLILILLVVVGAAIAAVLIFVI